MPASDEEVFTQKQEEAYDTLLEEGGEEEWIEADEVSDPRTLDALAKKGVAQVEENNQGDMFVAMAGVVLGEPPSPEPEPEEQTEQEGVETEASSDAEEESESGDEEATQDPDPDKLSAVAEMSEDSEGDNDDEGDQSLDDLIDEASWPTIQKTGGKLHERVDDEVMEEEDGPWGMKKADIVEFMHRHPDEAREAIAEVMENDE